MSRSQMRDATVREGARTDGPRLKRRRTLSTDKFYVPPSVIQEGFSYEWKRLENVGQPDQEHQVMLAENHWQPVQAADAPGMMPGGYEGVVKRGGMILMCRPDYLTREAVQEMTDMSKGMARIQEQRLGLTERGQLPRRVQALNRDYAPPSSGAPRSQEIPD